MTGRLLGVLGDELLQLGLGALVISMRRRVRRYVAARSAQRLDGAHIHDLDGFQPRPGRFDPEQGRGIASLHTSPELSFGRQKQERCRYTRPQVSRLNHQGTGFAKRIK